jgi:carboxymethylenebutenolidase
MCDEDTERDAAEYLKSKLSRREFNTLAAGTAVMMALPGVVGAVEVTGKEVDVTTPDGLADCFFVHPAKGKHPGVIIWPDIRGLRPAFRMMATRLAESGYAVLCVNHFYRSAKAPVVAEGESFGDPEVRARIMPYYQVTATTATNVIDAKAFVTFLDAQKSVDVTRKIGTTGYCMGGPMVLRTAAAVPDRIGAGATFHGGGLVTDQPDSPHLLIPEMDAEFLIAIAENDDKKGPGVKEILRDNYEVSGLEAEIEVYEGTLHGWCPPDSQVYDRVQAERAWSRLLALFDRTLGSSARYS